MSVFIFIQKYPIDFSERQNNLGIIQLRRSLSLGIDHIIEDDSICMVYKGESMCFEQDETSLIAYPGTQFFLVNIDSLKFEVIDGWINIEYSARNKEYYYQLIEI